MTIWWSWPPKSGVLPIPDEQDRAQVAPAAGQDVPDRPGARPHHRWTKSSRPTYANAKPYRQWIENLRIKLGQHRRWPGRQPPEAGSDKPLLDRQQAFGYAQEDIKFLMAPMANDGEEGIGSMGNDSPLAVLSARTSRCTTTSAAVCPGDQPADRPDPRSGRDVAGILHRPQAQPAGHQSGEPAACAWKSQPACAGLRGHGPAARH